MSWSATSPCRSRTAIASSARPARCATTQVGRCRPSRSPRTGGHPRKPASETRASTRICRSPSNRRRWQPRSPASRNVRQRRPMRDRLGRVAALVLLAAWATAAPLWAAERLALHYDVYYLAFRIVSVDVASNVQAEAYSASVALRTTGVFATFGPWEANISATGCINRSTLRPAAYRARNEYRSRRQRIDLDYGSGDSVRGEVDGMLTDDPRDEVPDSLRPGTVDPVTAGALVARRLAATGTCAG